MVVLFFFKPRQAHPRRSLVREARQAPHGHQRRQPGERVVEPLAQEGVLADERAPGEDRRERVDSAAGAERVGGTLAQAHQAAHRNPAGAVARRLAAPRAAVGQGLPALHAQHRVVVVQQPRAREGAEPLARVRALARAARAHEQVGKAAAHHAGGMHRHPAGEQDRLRVAHAEQRTERGPALRVGRVEPSKATAENAVGMEHVEPAAAGSRKLHPVATAREGEQERAPKVVALLLKRHAAGRHRRGGGGRAGQDEQRSARRRALERGERREKRRRAQRRRERHREREAAHRVRCVGPGMSHQLNWPFSRPVKIQKASPGA